MYTAKKQAEEERWDGENGEIFKIVKAISKMKSGKEAGPPGIAVEILNASSKTGIYLVMELANYIVYDGVVPADWEVSSIVNNYKEKGDALEWGNYRGLKLPEHIRKVVERIVEGLVREKVNIRCTVWIHARMWHHSYNIFSETITREVLGQKEKVIHLLEEAF